MSINMRPHVYADAVITCDVRGCEEVYSERFWGGLGLRTIALDDLAGAWGQGWTVWASQRGRRVYCPRHWPTGEMFLVRGGKTVVAEAGR